VTSRTVVPHHAATTIRLRQFDAEVRRSVACGNRIEDRRIENRIAVGANDLSDARFGWWAHCNKRQNLDLRRSGYEPATAVPRLTRAVV
jgi:hypothetical protein